MTPKTVPRAKVEKEYHIHSVGGADLFQHMPEQSLRDLQAQEAELYEQIGRLKMELEWLKKKLAESPAAQRALVEPGHPEISLRRPVAMC